MGARVTLISGGRAVKLAAGADDICAGNAGGAGGRHCRSASVLARDRRAARDLQRLRLVPLARGARLALTPALLGRMRIAFAAGSSRSACTGCQWKGLCDAVKTLDFAGCVLRG